MPALVPPDSTAFRVLARSLLLLPGFRRSRLARSLAHAEPVEPAGLDEGNARFQHFLAEIRRFSHGRKLFGKCT